MFWLDNTLQKRTTWRKMRLGYSQIFLKMSTIVINTDHICVRKTVGNSTILVYIMSNVPFSSEQRIHRKDFTDEHMFNDRMVRQAKGYTWENIHLR